LILAHAASLRALDGIWRDRLRFQKAGSVLNGIGDKPGQIDIFEESPPALAARR